MRQLLATLALVLGTSLLAHPASAQTTNAQQERMKVCNKHAGDQKLTGDARKTFMSEQQQKMKDCNATATVQNLTGDARKSFMSSCLKGS
jgi:hypothetical protein